MLLLSFYCGVGIVIFHVVQLFVTHHGIIFNRDKKVILSYLIYIYIYVDVNCVIVFSVVFCEYANFINAKLKLKPNVKIHDRKVCHRS